MHCHHSAGDYKSLGTSVLVNKIVWYIKANGIVCLYYFMSSVDIVAGKMLRKKWFDVNEKEKERRKDCDEVRWDTVKY